MQEFKIKGHKASGWKAGHGYTLEWCTLNQKRDTRSSSSRLNPFLPNWMFASSASPVQRGGRPGPSLHSTLVNYGSCKERPYQQPPKRQIERLGCKPFGRIMQGVFRRRQEPRRFSHLCSLAAYSAVSTSKSRQSGHCSLMHCGSLGFRLTTVFSELERIVRWMLHDSKNTGTRICTPAAWTVHPNPETQLIYGVRSPGPSPENRYTSRGSKHIWSWRLLNAKNHGKEK